MKFTYVLIPVLVSGVFSASGWAAQEEKHQDHHPTGVAAAPTVTPSGKASPEMAPMDSHIKAMENMHAKMMAAKTSEARNALMAEHMKTMQQSMVTMRGMDSRGMTVKDGEMAAHHQMMEKRMQMMESMMQMMMDVMPTVPSK